MRYHINPAPPQKRDQEIWACRRRRKVAGETPKPGKMRHAPGLRIFPYKINTLPYNICYYPKKLKNPNGVNACHVTRVRLQGVRRKPAFKLVVIFIVSPPYPKCLPSAYGMPVCGWRGAHQIALFIILSLHLLNKINSLSPKRYPVPLRQIKASSRKKCPGKGVRYLSPPNLVPRTCLSVFASNLGPRTF